MNPWEWITSTSSVDSLLTTMGIGVLALLFARDLILTKAQHLRRVEDLTKHHERELAEKDSRLADLREARDIAQEAARVERARADKAVASVTEIAGTLTQVFHVLESLDRALPKPPGGEHDRAR